MRVCNYAFVFVAIAAIAARAAVISMDSIQVESIDEDAASTDPVESISTATYTETDTTSFPTIKTKIHPRIRKLTKSYSIYSESGHLDSESVQTKTSDDIEPSSTTTDDETDEMFDAAITISTFDLKGSTETTSATDLEPTELASTATYTELDPIPSTVTTSELHSPKSSGSRRESSEVFSSEFINDLEGSTTTIGDPSDSTDTILEEHMTIDDTEGSTTAAEGIDYLATSIDDEDDGKPATVLAFSDQESKSEQESTRTATLDTIEPLSSVTDSQVDPTPSPDTTTRHPSHKLSRSRETHSYIVHSNFISASTTTEVDDTVSTTAFDDVDPSTTTTSEPVGIHATHASAMAGDVLDDTRIRASSGHLPLYDHVMPVPNPNGHDKSAFTVGGIGTLIGFVAAGAIFAGVRARRNKHHDTAHRLLAPSTPSNGAPSPNTLSQCGHYPQCTNHRSLLCPYNDANTSEAAVDEWNKEWIDLQAYGSDLGVAGSTHPILSHRSNLS